MPYSTLPAIPNPRELATARARGIQPHPYASGVGHMVHPDDVVECCPYGPAHAVHQRQLPCGNGWCVHRDGEHRAGPLPRESDAFAELLYSQPMSTDWAIKHEGWSIVAPDGACDLCTVIHQTTDCPGVLAHCRAGDHCTSTDAACAAATSYDHPSACEVCGSPLKETP